MSRANFAPFGLLLLTVSCSRPVTFTTPAAAPPSLLLGNFLDDYGNRFTITPTSWLHRPRSTYHIVNWNVADQYAIAQNGPSNPGQPRRWTRIDWIELTGMPPYEWAFCLTAYDAPSAAAAEATPAARREVPKTGCNGFPFSRMKRIAAEPPR